MNVNGMLNKNETTIALGTMVPAFSTSSAILLQVSSLSQTLWGSCPLHLLCNGVLSKNDEHTRDLDSFVSERSRDANRKVQHTCPANTVAVMLGQPAPLSVNSVKTAEALCLVGVMTHRQTITGTKLKM